MKADHMIKIDDIKAAFWQDEGDLEIKMEKKVFMKSDSAVAAKAQKS